MTLSGTATLGDIFFVPGKLYKAKVSTGIWLINDVKEEKPFSSLERKWLVQPGEILLCIRSNSKEKIAYQFLYQQKIVGFSVGTWTMCKRFKRVS